MKTSLTILMLASAVSLMAAERPKLICASRATSPVVLDGKLDEPAWKAAEVYDDFVSLTGDKMPRTTMRLLYDAEHLYLGVECIADKPELLRKGVEEIRQKRAGQQGFVAIKDFSNAYGVEVFIDPGASMINSYQILANAGGQICGQFKDNWAPFPVNPLHRAAFSDKGMSLEFDFPVAAFPGARIVEGEEWGFNLVRNDHAPAVIWKAVGGAFYEPKRYGRLMIGDYATWWRKKVEERMVAPVAAFAAQAGRGAARPPELAAMHRDLTLAIEKLRSEKRPQDLASLEGFLKLYTAVLPVERLFHRFDTLRATLDADAPPPTR